MRDRERILSKKVGDWFEWFREREREREMVNDLNSIEKKNYKKVNLLDYYFIKYIFDEFVIEVFFFVYWILCCVLLLDIFGFFNVRNCVDFEFVEEMCCY